MHSSISVSSAEPEIKLLTHDWKIHSELSLFGDVRTILYSRCDEGSLECLRSVPFGLGGGAVAPEQEEKAVGFDSKQWALQHLGEFMTIGGTPVWTPSQWEGHAARVENQDRSIFTPFFISWNGGINASFFLECKAGAEMHTIYRLLHNEMAKLSGSSLGPTLAVVMLASALTEEVVDKAMILSPTKQNAPTNGKLITDEANLPYFFRRNIVQQEQSSVQSQTLIAVGVGVGTQHPDSVRLQEFLEKAFYVTPNTTVAPIHSHAVVMGEVPVLFDELVEKCASGKTNPAVAASDLLKKHGFANMRHMVHIENDTRIRCALLGVGEVAF